jgi:hypothetical protein
VKKLAIDILHPHIDRAVAETDFFELARLFPVRRGADSNRQEFGNLCGAKSRWRRSDRVESMVGPLMSAMPPKAEALAAAVIAVCGLMLPP